uniref:ArsR family transcriptional regulator n=1 Tax=Ignisphaera aggregans TaxID=334771 RepID=A0A7C2VB04_9CREN
MSLYESLKRLNTLVVPSAASEEVDLLRLINYRMFMRCVNNEDRCVILSLIARGVTSANDIANVLGTSRTGIYRHLNILEKSGMIVHKDGRFYIAAKMFLVYDVEMDNDGYIRVNIHPDKGGFVDEGTGLVLVKGENCKCNVCKNLDLCTRAVKNLAKKLDVKIRSENPLNAFSEIVKGIIYRDVLGIINNGYLIVKPVYEMHKDEG